jgi:hypothetical protein
MRNVAVLLLLGALAWFGMGTAHAANNTTCVNSTTSTRTAAMSACQTWTSGSSSSSCLNNASFSGFSAGTCAGSQTTTQVFIKATNSATKIADGTFWTGTISVAYTAPSCTSPAHYQASSDSCVTCPAGQTWSTSNFSCVDPAACLARNADAKNPNAIVGGGAGTCIAGCTYKFVANTSTTIVSTGGNGNVVSSGQFQFDGTVCQTAPPAGFDPNIAQQQCVAAGSGQTMCIKPDGQHCYTASTGRQICWTPGETGSKTDNNVLQIRGPGTTAPAPPTIPNDTLTVSGTQTNTSATTTSGTVTTNVTNYVTGSGTTPPVGTPSGEPGDGSGGAKSSGTCGGASQNPCDTAGSASGSCSVAPTYTGDPVLGAILIQEWKNHCTANGNAPTEGACGTGGAVGSYVCTGDQSLCTINLHALEEKCRVAAKDSALHSDAVAGNAFADEGNGPSIFSSGVGVGQNLDGSRISLGGGTLIPDITLEGVHWSPPPEFDQTIALVKAILIAAFTLLAMLIAGGSRET